MEYNINVTMELKLSEKLRELRKANGNTQEALADFLNITVQAVSKWERGDGLPDITYLPQIAGFYSVTVDTLLGVDEVAKEAKFKEYFDEYQRLHAGPIREDGVLIVTRTMAKAGIDLLQAALKELPDCVAFMQMLANDLWIYAIREEGDEKNALLDEAEYWCRKILKIFPDTPMHVRQNANATLCRVLNAKGSKQLAEEMANEMPSMYESRDYIKRDILEGSELEEHLNKLAGDCIRTLNITVDQLLQNGFDIKTLQEQTALRLQMEEVIHRIGWTSSCL